MNWDLYPQIIAETMSQPLVQGICRLWQRWNSRAYPQVDAMLTIGEVMAQSLAAPLKTDVPIRVIPVSVDTERLQPIAKADNPFCREHGLTDKFVVLYSGKMGMGHNIECLLAAAQLLREYTDIVFVFIGNGEKQVLVEAAVQGGAANVRLFPLQDETVFPYSIACGDVGVVSQEALLAHLFMPSKTYSLMACGEAIVGIGTANDDLYTLLKGSGFGIPVTEATPAAVADAILALYKDRDRLNAMKSEARRTAVERYSNRAAAEAYRQLFAEL